MSTLAPTSVVSYTLNGHDVQLSSVDPNTTLNEWMRSQLGLSGTKKMCGEGGCGCCVVSVLRKDPTTGKDTTIAINSVSIQSNDEYSVVYVARYIVLRVVLYYL